MYLLNTIIDHIFIFSSPFREENRTFSIDVKRKRAWKNSSSHFPNRPLHPNVKTNPFDVVLLQLQMTWLCIKCW